MALEFSKTEFGGGFNLRKDPTSMGAEEFYLLSNGRNRAGNVMSIDLPLEIGGQIPEGKLQGCYSAGNFLLVFVAGEAWFKDYNIESSNFQQVPSFSMDPAVEFIYCELVPASTVNFQRKLSDNNNKRSDVELSSPSISSAVCVVVQDGVNQPWVIFPNGTARVTLNYQEWQNTDAGREYVPIGTLMLFFDGILYIAAKDVNPTASSQTNNILRSVTGRPLDFMVAINSSGDKIDPTNESVGGAIAVAHRVDYDEITCMGLVASVDGSFYVSTNKRSYLVTPDTQPENLIFGEPTFSNTPLFNTGCLNNFSLVNVLGDATFIDFTGLRSFNAVLQAKYEGKNLPFSSRVNPLFSDLVQDISCATQFDNYALYAVNTIFGYGTLVYDTLTEQFISIDLYSNLSGAIKMFAEVKTTLAHKLFFITSDDKLYEWNAGNKATVQFYPAEYVGGPQEQLRAISLLLLFADIIEAGEVTVISYYDRIQNTTETKDLTATYTPVANPQPFPFTTYTEPYITPVVFNFQMNSKNGARLGFNITWNAKATLVGFKVLAEPSTNNSGSFKQQALLYTNS